MNMLPVEALVFSKEIAEGLRRNHGRVLYEIWILCCKDNVNEE